MINMAVTRVKSMALAPIAIKAIFHCGSKQTVGMKVKRESDYLKPTSNRV